MIEKYIARAQRVQSLLCVGLDTDIERLPEHFRHDPYPQFAFNRWMIEQTYPYASAYKPNLAFYETDAGLAALKMTLDYLHEQHPDIVTIADAKRADIDSTNLGYVRSVFDWMGFDAVTLNPYLGQEALVPFLERGDKGCIILCRTSNPGADEFQNLMVGERPLWQVVAERVAHQWNTRGNCMLVVGATQPAVLREVRQLVGELTLLVPGVGAQGGDLESVIRWGCNHNGLGLIANVARAVIWADNPAEAARHWRDAINGFREF
ncbi:MAG: orotidine-5'-phosphate decarboxylase [Anaerolineales bacterium]|nr:orotidine-5'-phosphate decarboxylase [Anaerolineales bacterium]